MVDERDCGCQDASAKGPDTSCLSVASICEFADTVNLDDVREVLERQIACNTAISQEGLTGHWGSEIGRTLMSSRPIDVVTPHARPRRRRLRRAHGRLLAARGSSTRARATRA